MVTLFIITLVLWTIFGLVFYLSTDNDIIKNAVLYKKILAYLVSGPFVWLIYVIEYIIIPIACITDYFAVWLEKK